MLAGSLLVFVLALGFYITPALLGSPQNQMFGELIADQVNRFLAFGVASALSVVLIVVTFAALGLATRVISVRGALGWTGDAAP